MTRMEFVDKVKKKHGQITTDTVSEVLDAVWAVIEELLSDGKEVWLGRLGKLKTVIQSARTGRNPKTGVAIDVPEKTAIKFVPFKHIKELINS